MSIEIKVPALPESVSEATVVSWHKQPGDAVARDENLVDIETDKVVLEVPAPAAGTLGDIKAPEGETVTADQVLGLLEEGAAKSDGAGKSEPKPQPEAVEETSEAAEKVDMSPAVRRLVTEKGLNPIAIEASGPGGRLTKEDVLRHLEGDGADAGSAPQPATPAGDSSPRPEPPAPEPAVPPSSGEREERRVPMTRLRQRIAERLVEAQHNAAMLTTFNEVNMGPIMALRSRYKDRFEKAHDVRLGFMSFFVKAAVEALKRFPAVNASIDGTDIIYHAYYDIGIAVSSPRGLVVPVLRDADHMGFAEVESTIAGLGVKARDGKLSMEELTGGTFSITNGGIFGSLLSTPILNPPQSAILGMHKIQERPMVENGEVVVRPMMYLALSYDHRIIDGKEAVSFLVTIKDMIEDPARLLLEV
ncbi:2-oxoglutarate dehydrogenase complex dihydrolipoyllysine-residue succinyltransferase [Methylonatrum kenyense]|uniref:2-oxoglutarate dehydrogenase complex dihydrolipoyllysine-residue succinyltransferase n=1 Tax=Methylonatrum kenyense TaxID=455253 RepID=UPI0020BE56BE|nr:2-oxoglutarate dehydrogenase complex dihydrolipoyllysine-residue succinyltransferase [Methylonatrum kenyense]MCK8515337.1 2-oxoglutarate dehydrogenase complex dihydrolipoyllysine-residue succinyltransferase [Methylonatrum kenyense]